MRLFDLGRRSYAGTLELQRALHAGVADGRFPETWIAVEHDPVVTVGRQGKRTSLRVEPEALARQGVAFHEVERGGDVTYHGPGQLVIYPIVRLERFREVVPLVRKLEEAAIAACAAYGIPAERWDEHAGVWVGKNCICAVGLAIVRMTSLHGIALNVATRLDYDRLIEPCGLRERGITSIAHELGRDVAIADARERLLASLERVFERRFERSAIPPPSDLAALLDAPVPAPARAS